MKRALIALLALPLAACTRQGPPAPPSSSTHAAPALRFWSDAAGGVGSVIDSGAAAKLRPSRTDYCTMLSQLRRDGGAALDSAAADAAHAARTAFVAELSSVAPAAVAAAWQVLSPALDSLAAGKLPAGSAAVKQAAGIVADDARTSCHINLRT